MNNEYETIIGLEVHVELSTKTKIFCGCANDFGAAVNTHICPVCMGMPGALPVLNRQVLNYAVKASLALNCEINKEFRFDRKNYFYPDNPQNYQISQLYSPIGINGSLTIDTRSSANPAPSSENKTNHDDPVNKKIIRIHELHMEEDAGKLMHDQDTHETLIDFNRAGVPLLEIVSEPDMRSADEVISYLKSLRMLLMTLGISDCRMNEGSMRADVNLSVRKPASELGTRTEMKNLNSFKAIARAIEHESKRQIKLLEQGREVSQETRRWDDAAGESYVMRTKENAPDYRYFPDPDLPLYSINDEQIDIIRKSMPELPEDKIRRYTDVLGLSPHDAEQIISEKRLCEIFEETVSLGAPPVSVCNWLLGETMRIMNDRAMDADKLSIDPACLFSLIKLHKEHVINSTTAREIFEKIFDGEISDVDKYVGDNSLGMVSDTDALILVIDNVLAANPGPVSDYRSGKTKAIGFIIGQVMKEMKGKADPEAVRSLLEEKLH